MLACEDTEDLATASTRTCGRRILPLALTDDTSMTPSSIRSHAHLLTCTLPANRKSAVSARAEARHRSRPRNPGTNNGRVEASGNRGVEELRTFESVSAGALGVRSGVSGCRCRCGLSARPLSRRYHRYCHCGSIRQAESGTRNCVQDACSLTRPMRGNMLAIQRQLGIAPKR